MDDKEFRKQKARIDALRKKWNDRIGLGWWSVTYDYFRTPDNEENHTYMPRVVKGLFRTIMATETDWNYRQARISCYLTEIVDLDDDTLEEHYLHELMHIFLSPMRTKQHAGDEELVATTLARAFIWAENKPVKPSKSKEPIIK